MAALFSFIGFAQADGLSETGFNDQGIKWHSLEDGLRHADARGRPIYLLVQADWCGTCKAFQKVFYHPDIEALSERMVFVMVDRDQDPDVDASFAPDGAYIPRSMILAPDGQLRSDLRAQAGDFGYFLPTHSHSYLEEFLVSALQTFAE